MPKFKKLSHEDVLANDPLREFFVRWLHVTRKDADMLEQCLDAAENEENVQAFLQEHPILLIQHLGGGHPQARGRGRLCHRSCCPVVRLRRQARFMSRLVPVGNAEVVKQLAREGDRFVATDGEPQAALLQPRQGVGHAGEQTRAGAEHGRMMRSIACEVCREIAPTLVAVARQLSHRFGCERASAAHSVAEGAHRAA